VYRVTKKRQRGFEKGIARRAQVYQKPIFQSAGRRKNKDADRREGHLLPTSIQRQGEIFQFPGKGRREKKNTERAILQPKVEPDMKIVADTKREEKGSRTFAQEEATGAIIQEVGRKSLKKKKRISPKGVKGRSQPSKEKVTSQRL